MKESIKNLNVNKKKTINKAIRKASILTKHKNDNNNKENNEIRENNK